MVSDIAVSGLIASQLSSVGVSFRMATSRGVLACPGLSRPLLNAAGVMRWELHVVEAEA